MSRKVQGASVGPGSREPSPAVVALTGFDPSRETVFSFVVQPDWQPMDTVPKDGSLLNLFMELADFETGAVRTQVNHGFYYGTLPAFPDSGLHWVDSTTDNGGWEIEDEAFRPVRYGEIMDATAIARHNDLYCKYPSEAAKRINADTIWRYRGRRMVAWSLPWRVDITVAPPTFRDTDGSPQGPDPQGLDGEAATAGAEGIAR